MREREKERERERGRERMRVNETLAMMARVGLTRRFTFRMFANDACERMISHSNDQSSGDEGGSRRA
jgi:hypothetical protein